MSPCHNGAHDTTYFIQRVFKASPTLFMHWNTCLWERASSQISTKPTYFEIISGKWQLNNVRDAMVAMLTEVNYWWQ